MKLAPRVLPRGFNFVIISTMSKEKLENFSDTQKSEQYSVFESLFSKILNAEGDFIEYREDVPKEEFFDYLVREKKVLLHGSNDQHIQELKPRQANCRSKKFGNMRGVYATNDPVLPIFHAVIDKGRFKGASVSAVDTETDESGTVQKQYRFKVNKEMWEIQPWSEGVVYILPKESFEQGIDDDGEPVEEWISKTPVKPLAKLKVLPADFRFLKDIEIIEKE